MSVCIAAAYPWAKLAGMHDLDDPGVVIASDTRATQGGNTLAWQFTKQRLVSPNVLVCYTTSHGAATTLALRRVWGKRNVARIGEALRAVHEQHGGLTQLLAVVWRTGSQAQILELTPPDYRPIPRTGIVGIGDSGALDWFQNNFHEDPRPILAPSMPTPELDESFSRYIGHPVTFPKPRYTIDDAALNVGGALAAGIETGGGSGVGLPIQVWVVQHGSVRQFPLARLDRPALRMHNVTIDHSSTRVPDAVFPPGVARSRRSIPAVQLFP